MEKIWLKFCIAIAIIILLAGLLITCNSKGDGQKDITNDVIYPDTVYADIALIERYEFLLDSVSIELSHAKENIFVYQYKLERIAYYNSIAANNNNIIFLRGWINRVLNDEE